VDVGRPKVLPTMHSYAYISKKLSLIKLSACWQYEIFTSLCNFNLVCLFL